MLKRQAQVAEVKTEANGRSVLALSVALFSLLSLLGITIIGMFLAHNHGGPDSFKNVKDIIVMVLPVIGTWMGTVLAFYFSKENFEAANKSMQNFVQQISTSAEKLQSVMAKDVMIPLSKMSHYALLPDQDYREVKIMDLLAFMKGEGRPQGDNHLITRLPILDHNHVLKFLIHRSTFDHFLATYALEDREEEKALEELTLGDMEQSSSITVQDILKKACGFIREDANLREAQLLIERISCCLDIIVTKRGLENEPVIGWITNNTIAEHAKI